MQRIRTQYVGGAWTAPRREPTIVSVNPANPSVIIAKGEPARAEELWEALASARDAAGAWRDLAPSRRTAVLDSIGTAIAGRQQELSALTMSEVGKPIREARAEAELAATVAHFYAWISASDAGRVFPAPGDALSFTNRHPLGVVAVVTPFNFPVAIPAWKILAALACGNTVIWKPAPTAIETAAVLAETIGDLLPKGVLNLVLGGPEVVGFLIENGIDGMTFTGSTSAGLSIAAQCAARAIPIQCEMGGKNASVVLADADLDLAADSCAQAAFGFAGQKCTATSRLLIQKPIWDPFLQRLEKSVGSLVVGDPADESTTVGPLIAAEQVERLRSVRASAETRLGAPLLLRNAGGEGYYSDLAVMGPTPYSDALATTEWFGPLVAAVPVTDLSQAIEVNNSVPYGLSGAVFTRNLGSALQFAKSATCGIVRVNRTTTGLDYVAPFGGERSSGIGGKELGREALDFFTRSRTVWIG